MTSWEQWKQWVEAGSYTILPYVEKYHLSDRGTVPDWEQAWQSGSEQAFVLESGKSGKYTYLGLETASIISGHGERGQIVEGGRHLSFQLPPLEAVRRWMAPFRAPRVAEAPSFLGGCVGFWGYDVVRQIERLPVRAVADLPLPDYCFYRVEQLWIVDHERRELTCAIHVPIRADYPPVGDVADEASLRRLYAQAQAEVAQMKTLWDRFVGQAAQRAAAERLSFFRSDAVTKQLASTPLAEQAETAFAKSEFVRSVEKIQQYIINGDVFQVNLSLRQSRQMHCAPEEIYEWLRLLNPSPYMGLFKHDRFRIVSASPELLVSVRGNDVVTRPIAGTRRRGQDEQEDQALAEDLFYNEKERAEHIMLVDLLRNDIGRISKYGTVRVSDLMTVEYYSHVMHLVSEVVGKKVADVDVYDVIAAVFPGGTITGAPKIRTMEIIEELEPTRRGPYTGSLGWIDFHGNMEFNIVIRTLVWADGIGHVQAGAGIVIDSIPEREYEESLNKAKALWEAVWYSEMYRAT